MIEVDGISMQPLLVKGEKLIIKSSKQYFEGQIVIFQYRNERFVVHRIIKIIGNKVVCKGDNAITYERINLKDIIGVVSGKINLRGEYIVL